MGGGRAGGDPVAVTLPLGLRAGLRAAGCWLWGPAPPPIRLLRLGACSRRRLRCQQTRGASLPGPPLSNSERVPPTGPAANAGGGGRRFRGARGGSSPGGAGAGAAGCGVWVGPAGSRARCSGGSPASEGGARWGRRTRGARAVVTGGTDSTSRVSADVSLGAPCRRPPRPGERPPAPHPAPQVALPRGPARPPRPLLNGPPRGGVGVAWRLRFPGPRVLGVAQISPAIP